MAGAVALLRDFGFALLGLFRLEIVMGVGNTASEAVASATFEMPGKESHLEHLVKPSHLGLT
jgi:ribosomal-protein-serine acetyltransferase